MLVIVRSLVCIILCLYIDTFEAFLRHLIEKKTPILMVKNPGRELQNFFKKNKKDYYLSNLNKTFLVGCTGMHHLENLYRISLYFPSGNSGDPRNIMTPAFTFFSPE